MGKRLLYTLGFLLTLLVGGQIQAQTTVETGHEIRRGEINFTALADSYALHPPGYIHKELENDETEAVPVRPAITNPSLIHGWSPIFSPGVPTSYSPAPADTFESTLDNNTAFPPDTHGAVDSNYCMTTINTDVRIQSRTGAIISTVSLDAFFASVLPGGGTFDPRVHYDIATHRWIVVADGDAQTSTSCLLIAVSKTSNPTGGWWMYNVGTYPPGDYWLDYPDVGFNSKWIAISGNLFQNVGSGYGGCKMFVFNKASLLSGIGAPFTAFTQASSACICPAITYDATQNSLFAIETYNGAASGGGLLHMWKITGAVGSESMTSVGFPAYTGFNWQRQSNAVSGTGGADFAPQLGTSNKVQNNDDRIFQVVFMNNKLWTAHNAFLPYSTTVNPTRCSVMWWETDTLANPVQVGLVDDNTNTNFYAFPAIAVNTSDDALLGFSTFSSSIYPSAAYALHQHTDALSTMQSPFTYRHGTASYYKSGSGRNRWGDYSATCIDPLNQFDFWTLQEASASPANTFDTWWANIKPCIPPTATITPAGPTTFCAGGSVVLNSSTGAGYTYQWKLGGSTIAGATSSSYTASTAGNYTVLVTNLSCNATSAITTVVVNTIPSAVITPAGSTTFCAGGSVVLNATSGAGFTYQWSLGGSPVAGATTSSFTATAAGNYTVLVTSPSGCGATSAITTVVVNSLPTATITPAGATTFCSGGSVVLNGSAGAGLTYQWRIGGSPIAGATTAAYTANATGSYTVLITNGSGCSATSAATAVVVNPAPAAITGTATVCAGATTSLFDATPGGVWSSATPSVATISGAGVVTGIGSGGLATISYTVSGCAAIIVVTVNSISVAAIVGSTSVCIGGTLPLTDATPGGTWTSSNTAIATVGTGSGIVTGLALGSATITYSVSGTCGTASVNKLINVSNPTTVAPITGTLSICSGLTTTLSDITPSGVWSSSNTAIATIGTSGLVTAITSGTTTISYSVTGGGGCVSSATALFTVFSSFSAVVTPSTATSFCTGGSVVLTATTGSGFTYQWKKNGIIIPGAIASTYTATTSGDYTVSISIAGGCNSTSAPVTVVVNPLPIVTPSVNITATAGPIFCLTTSAAVFTAVPSNGGTSPVYKWYVNGSPTTTGLTFACTPAVGDIVKCSMTSNATCAFPATVSKSDTITVTTLQTPAVSVSAASSVICTGSNNLFSATPVFGGSSPSYRWTRNDTAVATGPSYIYMPHNGDVLKVTLYSNYPCLTVDSAVSTGFTVHAVAPVHNTVTVIVTQPGIVAGGLDTFIAIAPNGGSSPMYQWLLNGTPIVGATNSIYVTDSLVDGQLISCRETSNAPCATPPVATSTGVTVDVIPVGVRHITTAGNDFAVIPNPNRGAFTVEGTLKDQTAKTATVLVTDMLGRVVYNEVVGVAAGKLNKYVVLGSTVANGNYLVTISARSDQAVYHIVINK